jgi:IstB-like ATP binding protein
MRIEGASVGAAKRADASWATRVVRAQGSYRSGSGHEPGGGAVVPDRCGEPEQSPADPGIDAVDAANAVSFRGRAVDELMPKTLATATVDRLLHHAHVCQTSGDSVRLSQAMAGKGVIALN